MTIGIIGPGLIGGSIAIDLRRKGFADKFLGVEKEPVNAAAALQMGIVDEIVSLEECAARADIVVVAIPVGAAVKVLPQILDVFSEKAGGDAGASGQVVIDTCSTKEAVAVSVKGHPMRSRYVATHPMSGTEYCGPWAALPGLFDGRACVFADCADSAPDAVAVVEKLYDVLNMRPVYMDSKDHDVHTAYVSHLSHVISFALAQTVLDKEKDEKHIFDLASGGFSSTVRLAKSGADMWVPIFIQNKENVLGVLDTYRDKLDAFRDAIERSDEGKLRDFIAEANRIKRIIR